MLAAVPLAWVPRLAFLAHLVHGEPAAPEGALRWTAPDECPSKQMVQNWLSELTGATDAEVEARVRQVEGDRWTVDLRPLGDTGWKRTISGESCESVSRAAVLAVALSTSPDGAVGFAAEGSNTEVPETQVAPVAVESVAPETSEANPPEAPEPELTVTPAPAATPVEAPDRDAPPPRLHPRMTIGGLLGFGALPGVSGGLGMAAGVQGRAWAIDLEARHWFASFAPLPEAPASGVQLQQTTLDLSGGLRLSTRALALELGPSLQLRYTVGRAVQTTSSRRSRRFAPAVGAYAAGHVAVYGGLSIGVRVAGLAPLVRPDHVVDGVIVHEASALGLESALLIRYTFGRRNRTGAQ